MFKWIKELPEYMQREATVVVAMLSLIVLTGLIGVVVAIFAPDQPGAVVVNGKPTPQARNKLVPGVYGARDVWDWQSSPGWPFYSTVVESVSATGPRDAWVAGTVLDEWGFEAYGYTAHWNGTDWLNVLVAEPQDSINTELHAITAIAPNDVWAVGEYQPGDGTSRVLPLMEHYDGKTWSIVSAPTPPAQGDPVCFLTGVAYVSPTEVWATGYWYDTADTYQAHGTLTLRWNGSQWEYIPSIGPVAHNSYFLTGVAASPHGDVVAVGYQYTGTGPGKITPEMPLILSWDRAAQVWHSTSPLVEGASSATLRGVAIVGSQGWDGERWAVGSYIDANTRTQHALALRYDGIEWQPVGVGTGNPDGPTDLWGVGAIDAHSVWAIGDQGEPGAQSPLAVKWDGERWSPVAIGSAPQATDEHPVAVTIVPGDTESSGTLWAAGYFQGQDPTSMMSEIFVARIMEGN